MSSRSRAPLSAVRRGGAAGYCPAAARRRLRMPRCAPVFPARITHVPEVMDTVDVLRQILREGDVCLVKGAHGMYMGRIVAALEAHL